MVKIKWGIIQKVWNSKESDHMLSIDEMNKTKSIDRESIFIYLLVVTHIIGKTKLQ